jgi:predicted metalloprotease with PDZ domain
VSTQYFWSWRGGYDAPVSTSYTDDIVTSIVYAETAHFDIWAFPKAKNYPATWCVAAVQQKTPRNTLICVPNEEDARDLIDALATLAVASGTVPGGSFGITFGMSVNSLPEKEAKKHPDQTGCEVGNVLLEGPPALAGLKNGDILHAVDGKPCDGPNAFGSAVLADTNGKPEGGVVRVQVFRKGQLMPFDLHYPNSEVNVSKLQQSAASPAQKNAPPTAPGAAPMASASVLPSGFHLGIAVRAVADADVAPMGLTKARGIVVVDVDKGSLAEKMGILPGDVILEVNNSEIGDVQLFVEYVGSGEAKKFHVWRKGQVLDLVVPQSL